MKRLLGLLLLTFGFTPVLFAQNHGGVGIFGQYFRHQGTNGTNFLGLGGRASLNVHANVQLEAEMAYDFEQLFTESFTDPATQIITLQRSPLRVLHGLFGPKFQTGGGSVRAFVALKGGFINFRFDDRPATFATFVSSVEDLRGNNVNGVLYPGGGLEIYKGPFGFRFEIGDEIYFRDGAHHNLRIAFGPQIRF